MDRPSLHDYETARRRVLDAAGRPEELRDALREMRVARDMLPRSAAPVVDWLDELLPLPTPDQAGPAPVATDWIWRRIERRDHTAGAVSLVATGVALAGLLLWVTAALAGGLAARGALGVLGAGLLLAGSASLYLAQRLVPYGREYTGRALLRSWTGVELLLAFVAAGVGTAGVLAFAGTGGDGQRAAVLWSATGILAIAIGYLVAIAVGLVLAARPPERAGPGPAALGEERLLRSTGARGVRVPPHGRLEAVDEQLRLLQREVGQVGKRQRSVARAWRSAYFWLGLPATALAAAAGVVGVAATGHPGEAAAWWTAGLALAAAALTALSTALNPGRQWEAARHSAARCDSLARELHVLRSLDLPRYADGDDAREAIEYVLTRLDQVNGAAGSQSYWSRWRTGQRPATARSGHSTG